MQFLPVSAENNPVETSKKLILTGKLSTGLKPSNETFMNENQPVKGKKGLFLREISSVSTFWRFRSLGVQCKENKPHFTHRKLLIETSKEHLAGTFEKTDSKYIEKACSASKGHLTGRNVAHWVKFMAQSTVLLHFLHQ